jgi:tRNA(Ile)-lysidine synthetase-like protein
MLSYLRSTRLIKYYFQNPSFNYDTYKNILQIVPNCSLKIKEKTINLNEPLLININNICKNLNTNKFIISLSGGVDSMVLVSILNYLNFDIIAIHINYNNRDETKQEQDFIIEWCKFNNIKLYFKEIVEIKRNDSKRSDYESITKNIRFQFYKEIIKKENVNYILLGHHKDDIIENIVANICRGRNYLDLAVIRERNKINDIDFIRPMLNFHKLSIYSFASTYHIPYFKDTTPDWSVRGKYRKTIEPAIQDTFTIQVKENLLNIGNQADDWNYLIQLKIINPFLDLVIFKDNDEAKIIEFNIKDYTDYPFSFWFLIFMKIFNKIGQKSPSRKSIETLINLSKKGNNRKIKTTLDKNTFCEIDNFNILIKIIKT